MKIDLYTKSILTIIAVCLVALVINQLNIIPSAYAAENTKPDQPTKTYGMVPLNGDGTIDVNIKSIAYSVSNNLPVVIKKYDADETIDVKIKKIDHYYSNSLPVVIKKNDDK